MYIVSFLMATVQIFSISMIQINSILIRKVEQVSVLKFYSRQRVKKFNGCISHHT